MAILGYMIIALAKMLGLMLNLYTMLVVVAALISWVSPDPYNPIVRIIYGLTYPAFRLVRRFFPNALLRMRIDLSPIFVLLLLMLLETILVGPLLGVGREMIAGSNA